MMTREEYDTHVHNLLLEIDFNMIEKVMALLDWRWQDRYVTTHMLYEQAKKMLLALYGQPSGTIIRTGGLQATIYCERLELLFVLQRGTIDEELYGQEMPCDDGEGEVPSLEDMKV